MSKNIEFQFVSNNHFRYQNNQLVNMDNQGATRLIEVKKGQDNIYLVTIYNMVGIHPVWGNNVQMSTKEMAIKHQSDKQVYLQGVGSDPLGFTFADYALTINFIGNNVESCILHLLDRDVRIEYVK